MPYYFSSDSSIRYYQVLLESALFKELDDGLEQTVSTLQTFSEVGRDVLKAYDLFQVGGFDFVFLSNLAADYLGIGFAPRLLSLVNRIDTLQNEVRSFLSDPVLFIENEIASFIESNFFGFFNNLQGLFRQARSDLEGLISEYVLISDGDLPYLGSSFDGFAVGIFITFSDGSGYQWLADAVGNGRVEDMIELAEQGDGLGSYIYQNVRFSYS